MTEQASMFSRPAILRTFVSSLILFLLLCIAGHGLAQKIDGQVTDSAGNSLAFATIKFGSTNKGMIADLNGKFSLVYKDDLLFIEVSHLNFRSKQVAVTSSTRFLLIKLQPLPGSLNGVIVKTTGSKLKRILNNAIAHRSENNPDKYDWYRCKVYYKMVADFTLPDTILQKDTSSRVQAIKKMNNDQHLFMTETYSIRTWQKPARLQEEVTASRTSGFSKSVFTNLVTDFLPFHAYNDFINLNRKDYHNPVSKGLFQRFDFKLDDEILGEKDTVWLISFKPKSPEELQGVLYISSDGFAITHLIAHNIDSLLKRDVGIEQQYEKQDGRWFPRQLNYSLKWQQQIGTSNNTISLKGYSVIDSTSFVQERNFRFDKAHTVKLLPEADHLTDSSWQQIRPKKLDHKEARTYTFMDSIAKVKQFDKMLRYIEKIVDSKFPVNNFDINLERIYSYNNYEKNRFGLGMQTSEKISKWFSLGGWAGYGSGDKTWKYGAFGEWYFDRYKEFSIRAVYSKDLRDPGRLQINQDLDENYLRSFIMNRVDRTEKWSLSLIKRLGYLSTELTASRENIVPRYQYGLAHEGKVFNSFTINDIEFRFRYAYGERTVPAFGKYLSVDTKYPVVYGRINSGLITNTGAYYTQVLGAISWQKHINRSGNERFLLLAGTSVSNKPLPLTKLFAGNGFRIGENAIYLFGGMQTMLPYEYYSDRFLNFYWKHDFDLTLLRLNLTKSFSMAPMPSLAYNWLWGNMNNRTAHEQVSFSIPNTLYHETGIMVNRLLRLRFLSLYYFTLNTGYFYHWTSSFDASKNGRFVLGFGVDL